MLSSIHPSIHPSKENLIHRIIVIEDVEPHHYLLQLNNDAVHPSSGGTYGKRGYSSGFLPASSGENEGTDG